MFQGVLELVFPHTGEKNVYTLIGKGGDPLAQGHIPVDCQARWRGGGVRRGSSVQDSSQQLADPSMLWLESAPVA